MSRALNLKRMCLTAKAEASHNAARKKTVTLGECNYDMVEVINGLDEGEKVIVNDMGKYKNKKKLRIKK